MCSALNVRQSELRKLFQTVPSVNSPMRLSQQVDELPQEASRTDIQPDQAADVADEPYFAPRVIFGTLIGVFSCLLLAALLMLMFWLPFRGGNGLADDGLAGAGRGSGDGRGHGVGTGESNQADDGGNDEATVFDQESIGANIAKTAASGDVSGDQNGLTASTSDPNSQQAVVTAEPADSEPPRKQRYTIAPIEALQALEQEEPGPAQAQAPGMFEGRGTEERAKLAKSEGGNAASEKAVEDGLKWLAKHQDKSGVWSLHAFSQVDDCDGQCGHQGLSSDAGGTGFGLLPFLGAGYTHKSGKYKNTVQNGLDWLVADQTKEGTFQHCMAGNLYAHGVATIALCEAYAMTKDPKLKGPAQRAINYIVMAQHNGGGWRYRPGEAGDTSVTGWQVIALRSAQQGGLRIPGAVFTKISQYLDSVQTDKEGSGYRYMPGDRITDAMVAEGLLCRIYTSNKLRRGELRAGVEYLQDHLPHVGGELYYWYYATQVLHHYGGAPWDEWNPVMRDLLIEAQATEGHPKGSWAPQGGHDGSGGRVYATSLALLTLEVYYRHKRAFD